jgi:hypothetical protein
LSGAIEPGVAAVACQVANLQLDSLELERKIREADEFEGRIARVRGAGEMASLDRRLLQLEREANAADERCVFCEQAYWTMVAVNGAIGPYSTTEYGNEVGLLGSRILQELRTGEPPDYLAHLPALNLDEELAGVMEAVRLVREARPAREGCRCVEGWQALWRLEARILSHYPAVGAATIECLERYAASPLEGRALYHFAGSGAECVCTPSHSTDGLMRRDA